MNVSDLLTMLMDDLLLKNNESKYGKLIMFDDQQIAGEFRKAKLIREGLRWKKYEKSRIKIPTRLIKRERSEE